MRSCQLLWPTLLTAESALLSAISVSCGSKGVHCKFKSWNDLHRFWHIFPQLKGIFLPVKKQSSWKMSKYGFAGRNTGAFRFRWRVKTKRWERYTFSAINISALKSQPINLAELSYITISPETLTSITLDLFECGVQCNWTWLVSRLLRRCEQVSVCES